MADQKFLAKGSGTLQEVQAVSTSAGDGDAGKIPCLDAAGRLDENMLPLTGWF